MTPQDVTGIGDFGFGFAVACAYNAAGLLIQATRDPSGREAAGLRLAAQAREAARTSVLRAVRRGDTLDDIAERIGWTTRRLCDRLAADVKVWAKARDGMRWTARICLANGDRVTLDFRPIEDAEDEA